MADSLESLIRAREAPFGGNAGAGMAGFAFGGGNSPRAAQMQAQGELMGARAGDAMAQARQRQQQEVARAGFAQRLRTQGQPDMADMVEGGLNPEQFAQANINNQRAKILSDAYTKATGTNPDRNTINLLMQIYHGEPTDLTKVEGGMVFNPKMTPDQSGITPTQVGLADIAEKNARAGEAGAQAGSARAAAGEHSALADLARARTTKINEEATAPKTGHALSREQVLSGFGTPDKNGVMQTDPKKYEDFLYFQQRNAARDPRYLDANYALIQYKGGQASRESALADMAVQDERDAYDRTYHGGTQGSAPPPSGEQPRGENAPATLFDGQATPAESSGGESSPRRAGVNGQKPSSTGKFQEGKVYVDAKGNKAIYRNGQFIEQ